MHGVNLDLLKTTPHRADGSPRDPHAHHGAEHLALRRAARRAWWQAALRRLLGRSSMTSSLLAASRQEAEGTGGADPTPLRP